MSFSTILGVFLISGALYLASAIGYRIARHFVKDFVFMLTHRMLWHVVNYLQLLFSLIVLLSAAGSVISFVVGVFYLGAKLLGLA